MSELENAVINFSTMSLLFEKKQESLNRFDVGDCPYCDEANHDEDGRLILGSRLCKKHGLIFRFLRSSIKYYETVLGNETDLSFFSVISHTQDYGAHFDFNSRIITAFRCDCGNFTFYTVDMNHPNYEYLLKRLFAIYIYTKSQVSVPKAEHFADSLTREWLDINSRRIFGLYYFTDADIYLCWKRYGWGREDYTSLSDFFTDVGIREPTKEEIRELLGRLGTVEEFFKGHYHRVVVYTRRGWKDPVSCKRGDQLCGIDMSAPIFVE